MYIIINIIQSHTSSSHSESSGAMTGEKPVEVQNCRKITDHFRGISRTFPNLIKENRRMSKSNRLDLQTLGSQPVMPKKNPRSLITSLDWGEPVVGYR